MLRTVSNRHSLPDVDSGSNLPMGVALNGAQATGRGFR